MLKKLKPGPWSKAPKWLVDALKKHQERRGLKVDGKPGQESVSDLLVELDSARRAIWQRDNTVAQHVKRIKQLERENAELLNGCADEARRSSFVPFIVGVLAGAGAIAGVAAFNGCLPG